MNAHNTHVPTLPADIFDALHALLRRFRARAQHSLLADRPELSFGEMRLLMLAGQSPGCTQKEMVEYSSTDKAQTARTLAQLESKGWLVRSESQRDRRVRCLHLSAAGQALFAQLAERHAALAAELLAGCPAAQQQQLLALLRQALA